MENKKDIQGENFDIISTDINPKLLIGKKIKNKNNPGLIVYFPNSENINDNAELLVSDINSYIHSISTKVNYIKPLNIKNNNIYLSYDDNCFSVFDENNNNELTLSNNIKEKLSNIEVSIKKLNINNVKLANDIETNYTTLNNTCMEISAHVDTTYDNMNSNYTELKNSVSTQQKKISINLDSTVPIEISLPNLFSEENTIYDIAGNINFNNEYVNIGKNSVLSFSGGTINNAHLIGNNTEIISSKYKIFNNVTLSNSFACKLYPEWFGAKGDGVIEDTEYINNLCSNDINNDIVFSNDLYLTKFTLDNVSKNIYIYGVINLLYTTMNLSNCKMIFGGNGKLINGKLNLNNVEIVSDSYQIFDNIEFVNNSTIVNNTIPVEWFGAKGDGVTDDSNAINKAIMVISSLYKNNMSIQPAILLSHNIYKINNTIHIYKNYSKFICLGTIIINENITAIEISGSYIDIYINSIKNRYCKGDIIPIKIEGMQSPIEYPAWDHPDMFIGTAIKIQQSIFHGKLVINEIDRFDTGILFIPRVFADANINIYHNNCKEFVGIQYCNFDFKMIHAKHGIVINLAPDKDSIEEQNKYINMDAQHFWVNENVFNGGRLYCTEKITNINPAILFKENCGIGIEVIKSDIINSNTNYPVGLVCNGIDGNMFNHIGFEGLWQAIKLWKCKFHMFNDIRMCESLFAGTVPNDKEHPWIDLADCENCNFNIKGLIPMDKLLLNNCRTIKFTGLFTEPYDKSTEDIFGTTKNRFTKLYGDNAIRSHKENNNIIIDDDPSKIGFNGIIPINELSNANIINNIYATENNKKYNFNNLLFKHIKYSNIDCNSFEISTICKLKVQAEKEILIDFKDSIWSLRPEMLINIELGQNASVSFVYDNIPINLFLSNENKITKSGNYKVVYQLNQVNIEDSIAILQV